MKQIAILILLVTITCQGFGQIVLSREKEAPYVDTVTIKAGVIIGDQVKVVNLYRIEYYDYLPHPADIFYGDNEPFGLHHVFITDMNFKDYREPIMFYKTISRTSIFKFKQLTNGK